MSESEKIHIDIDYEEEVRARAYLMWEADGRPDGGADDYWHRARERIESEQKSAYPPAQSNVHRS